mmetsp:Transcript_4057/g.9193  ORF Transcript_4057/g.9193 Transcript_4057/m.9193 type:complete len:365 (+) Transcript_4057:145-1239(+)
MWMFIFYFSLFAVFLVQTVRERLGKFLPVQVFPDKDKLVDPLFIVLPWVLGGPEVDLLVDALKDELDVSLPVKGQEPLRPVEVRRPLLQEVHHEHVEPLGVEVPLELQADRLDGLEVVVGLPLLRLEKIRVDPQNGFHLERVETEDLPQRGPGFLGFDDRREAVDPCQSFNEGLFLVGRHEINLVEEDLVGKGHLLVGLVDVSRLWFLLVQVQGKVLGVRQADDAVQEVVLAHLGIRLQGVHDRRRIREPGRFQEDRVEVLPALGELPEGSHQIPAHRAADTAVVHRDEVLGGVQGFGHQAVVDRYLSELVLEDADLPLGLLFEDVIDEGCFSGSEESRDHRDRCEVGGRVFGDVVDWTHGLVL